MIVIYVPRASRVDVELPMQDGALETFVRSVLTSFVTVAIRERHGATLLERYQKSSGQGNAGYVEVDRQDL